MERIHVDFLGPLDGKMILVMVDDYSKWPEAIIMKSTTAEETINILHEIFSRLGIPKILISDNGPQFTSDIFKEFIIKNNIIHKKSPPYHPATNGIAERLFQTIKGCLGNSINIKTKLCHILRDYRNSIQSTTGVSPAIRMLGRYIRTWHQNLKVCLDDSKEQGDGRKLNKGDSVLVRMYNQENEWVVGTVEEVIGERNYLINEGEKKYTDINQLIKRNHNTPMQLEIQPNSSFNSYTVISNRNSDLQPPINELNEELNYSTNAETTNNSSDVSYYPTNFNTPESSFDISGYEESQN